MTDNQGVKVSTRRVCHTCGGSVKWVGRTPYGESYICEHRCTKVTPLVLEEILEDEDVTIKRCAVCGEVMHSKYSNALTCSPRCRKRLSRMTK